MQILFIVPSLKSGGLERVASLLASKWSEQKHDVTLLTLDSKRPFYQLNKAINLVQAPELYDKKGGIRKAFALWNWLPNEVKKIKAEIILSFGEGYNAFVVANLGFLKTPIFLSNRTTPLSSLTGLRGVLNPVFYPKSHLVFVQTQRAKEILKNRYRGTKFEVLPNPIMDIKNTTDYKQKSILNVGSIGGKKNQSELIDIFSELSEEFKDWNLIFAGDGPNKDCLQDKVLELNLEKRIIFKGVVKDLDSLYDQSSIFAFTSLLEGFPNALGEAMRAGMAVISYDCLTGPSELINHSRNGYLIPIKEKEAYKTYLKKLMINQNLREELGTQARITAESYNLNRIASLYISYFSASRENSQLNS